MVLLQLPSPAAGEGLNINRKFIQATNGTQLRSASLQSVADVRGVRLWYIFVFFFSPSQALGISCLDVSWLLAMSPILEARVPLFAK